MTGVSIPGYGEAVDPARLPPYAEDLGNGVTHRVDADGTERWYKDGKLHRDGDKPAVVHPDGAQSWYKDDKLHRDGDKPAVIHADGTRIWCRDNKIHRGMNRPAYVSARGIEEYWVDGVWVRCPWISTLRAALLRFLGRGKILTWLFS